MVLTGDPGIMGQCPFLKVPSIVRLIGYFHNKLKGKSHFNNFADGCGDVC